MNDLINLLMGLYICLGLLLAVIILSVTDHDNIKIFSTSGIIKFIYSIMAICLLWPWIIYLFVREIIKSKH